MKNKSIVEQTAFRVSLAYMVVLFGLSVGFTSFIITYMRDRILEGRAAGVETAADFMESNLESMIDPIISLGEYEPTSRLVSGYYSKYTPAWMTTIRNLDAYLRNISMFNRFIVDINLLDADVHTVYSMNNILKSDYPYGTQDWFTDALKQNEVVKCAAPHGVEHLVNIGNRTTFSLIYPIRKQKTETGYILMEVDLMELAGFLKEGEDRIGYLLLDRSGAVIFDYQKPGREAILSEDELSDPEQRSEKECRLLTKDKSYLLIRQLKMNHWIIVLDCSRQMILQPVRRLFAVVVGIVLLTVLIIFLITLMQVRRLAKPMNALIQRINSYDGSGSVPVDYQNAPAEVTLIGERFEVMADKMNNLIREVYVAELQNREARLEALMNQINPHFLYNVLQLIETKAILTDNREIEDLIQALSQMMRYAMERGRDMVSVREELSYIENYLMFYHERFPALFTHEIHCPDELLSRKMPKFVLQPVVENCIKHAFDRTKTGGCIWITVHEEENDILFEVKDNGCGMTPEQLEKVRKKLAAEYAGSGIGIVNTNARIRLMYGNDYGLDVQSAPGEGTAVSLRIAGKGDENVQSSSCG